MEMVGSGEGGPGVNSDLLVALSNIFFHPRAGQALGVALRTWACPLAQGVRVRGSRAVKCRDEQGVEDTGRFSAFGRAGGWSQNHGAGDPAGTYSSRAALYLMDLMSWRGESGAGRSEQ